MTPSCVRIRCPFLGSSVPRPINSTLSTTKRKAICFLCENSFSFVLLICATYNINKISPSYRVRRLKSEAPIGVFKMCQYLEIWIIQT